MEVQTNYCLDVLGTFLKFSENYFNGIHTKIVVCIWPSIRGDNKYLCLLFVYNHHMLFCFHHDLSNLIRSFFSFWIFLAVFHVVISNGGNHFFDIVISMCNCLSRDPAFDSRLYLRNFSGTRYTSVMRTILRSCLI